MNRVTIDSDNYTWVLVRMGAAFSLDMATFFDNAMAIVEIWADGSDDDNDWSNV